LRKGGAKKPRRKGPNQRREMWGTPLRHPTNLFNKRLWRHETERNRSRQEKRDKVGGESPKVARKILTELVFSLQRKEWGKFNPRGPRRG